MLPNKSLSQEFSGLISGPYKKWIWFLLVTHFLAALFSLGFFHWDEHFQILEFFNLKLGLTYGNDLPWEYHEKMRSWVQPFFYFYWSKVLSLIGLDGPFVWATMFRLFSALLGSLSLLFFVLIYKDKRREKTLIILSSILWFLPFIHARISSEGVGGSLFCIGVALFLLPLRGFKKNTTLYFLMTGFLLGLSFLVRFQLGFSIFFLALWALVFKRYQFKWIGILCIGIALSLLAGFLIDYWGYGQIAFSPWEYLRQNLFLNKASNWGVSPWWDYFRLIFKKGIFPIGPLIITFVLIYWARFPKSPVTWVSLPFLLVHSLIGHKELRFLFPMVSLLPIMITQVINEFSPFFKKYFTLNPIGHRLKQLTITMSLALLIISSLKPANSSIKLFQFLENYGKKPSPLYIYGEIDPFFQAQLKMRYYYPFPPSTNVISKKEDLQSFFKNKKDSWIFTSRGNEFFKLKSFDSCQLAYTSYPEWALKLNYFNWVKRSKVWSLFHCQKENKNS